MPAVSETREAVEKLAKSNYEWGFETNVEMDLAPKGLNEDIVRLISARKKEPQWMLDWRLKAFRAWQDMSEPDWAKIKHPPIDYQDAHYFAQPKKKSGPK
ncbi:MAG: Fe-S cluster assembly protein SufB, partial [Bombella apis]|nr:Fe-S cluster assembly protein SufB [Bombella apis]